VNCKAFPAIPVGPQAPSPHTRSPSIGGQVDGGKKANLPNKKTTFFFVRWKKGKTPIIYIESDFLRSGSMFLFFFGGLLLNRMFSGG